MSLSDVVRMKHKQIYVFLISARKGLSLKYLVAWIGCSSMSLNCGGKLGCWPKY